VLGRVTITDVVDLEEKESPFRKILRRFGPLSTADCLFNIFYRCTVTKISNAPRDFFDACHNTSTISINVPLVKNKCTVSYLELCKWPLRKTMNPIFEVLHYIYLVKVSTSIMISKPWPKNEFTSRYTHLLLPPMLQHIPAYSQITCQCTPA